jgi:hypothetical protein
VIFMAVNMTTADKALKSFYLGVVSEQLNTNTNPLFNKIKMSTSNVWGKEVRKAAPFGINGGVGAGTEDGDLPVSGSNGYVQFVSQLKNLYGRLEISDKAVRASENSAGAFVNLLNDEMEGLLRASKFNFSRMLHGDGSGKLANVEYSDTNKVTADNVRNLVEGMIVDVYLENGTVQQAAATITSIDRANMVVTMSGVALTSGFKGFLTVQGSYNKEITGLGEIFKSTGNLYGVDRATNSWMVPYMEGSVGTLSDTKIQKAIDKIEDVTGGAVDFICCSAGVKRAYQEYLESTKRNVNTLDLAGGYKAISYSGIPVVSDRFMPAGTMYLLDTKEFNLHQLCDWRWLEDQNGNILQRVPGKPVYTATLVKYAELMCNRPASQGALTGITEA